MLLLELSEKLVAICDGIDVSASGVNCTLSECALSGDYTWGHFWFSGDCLSIAYRTSDDDLDDAYHPDPDGPTYSVEPLSEHSRADWLLKLVHGGSLQSLLKDLADSLVARATQFADATSIVRQIGANPSAEIASSFEEAASGLGYSRAIVDWGRATSEVHSNPESAITLGGYSDRDCLQTYTQ